MNEAEIAQCLNSHPLTRNVFQGVFARDEINQVFGRKNTLFVFNADKRKGPGEHWVLCYWPQQGAQLYFDSYGFAPLDEEFYVFLLKKQHAFQLL